jgi:hypothetical protein
LLVSTFGLCVSVTIDAPFAMADQAGPQCYQIEVAPLRISGKDEPQFVGDAAQKTDLNTLQRYQVEVAPLLMSGKSEQLSVGEPARKDMQDTRQRFEIQVAPLQMSGYGERMSLNR